jgi:predicted SAM-dependent methyltransferase
MSTRGNQPLEKCVSDSCASETDSAAKPHERRALNVGCGQHFHPDWVNVDTVASHPSVIEHDIRLGLPFADACFDCVYLCHVLEHLPRKQATALLRECQRTLVPGGVVRVVVPELERMARGYLEALERARGGDAEAEFEREWFMLEMFDQVGRNESGGDCARVASGLDAAQRDFVIRRWGALAREIFANVDASPRQPSSRRTKQPALRAGDTWSRVRERLKKALLGDEYRLLQIGRFRESGERHCWMYDAYSLSRELAALGFDCPKVQTASSSAIPDWARFHLDTEPDGAERKPDSVYVEARKL